MTTREHSLEVTLSPRRRWAALTVLSASLLVVVLDMTILNVALPKLTADLRPSAQQVLWIVDVYSLVLAGLLVSVSALADSTRWLFTADAKWVLTGLIALVGVVLVVTALPGNRRD